MFERSHLDSRRLYILRLKCLLILKWQV
jgi:hypothetical protein